MFVYVVDSTLLQVKEVVERKMKERELNRNSRGADGGVAWSQLLNGVRMGYWELYQ